MKKRIAKLIDLKSIITMAMTAAFITLVMRGEVPAQFMTTYTMVLMYYFTRKDKETTNGNVTEGAD